MSENIIQQTAIPNSLTSLQADLRRIGLKEGMHVIVHSSLSKLGWTIGGATAVVNAMMAVVTNEGTLVMPTQSGDNSDPANWSQPPVPEAWWPLIRDETPAYDPDTTPTRGMGIIVDTFRYYPHVIRSAHPQTSFAAWGRYATEIIAPHYLDDAFGENSPLARLYTLDTFILLLGVNHSSNTALHLAESRSNYAKENKIHQSAAVMANGKREWVTWTDVDYDADDFATLGADFESSIGYTPLSIGMAEVRLHSLRIMVDFGVEWLNENRKTKE